MAHHRPRHEPVTQKEFQSGVRGVRRSSGRVRSYEFAGVRGSSGSSGEFASSGRVRVSSESKPGSSGSSGRVRSQRPQPPNSGALERHGVSRSFSRARVFRGPRCCGSSVPRGLEPANPGFRIASGRGLLPTPQRPHSELSTPRPGIPPVGDETSSVPAQPRLPSGSRQGNRLPRLRRHSRGSSPT